MRAGGAGHGVAPAAPELLQQLLHQLHQQLLQLLQQLLQQQPRSLATLTGLVFKVTPAGDLGTDPGAR